MAKRSTRPPTSEQADPTGTQPGNASDQYSDGDDTGESTHVSHTTPTTLAPEIPFGGNRLDFDRLKMIRATYNFSTASMLEEDAVPFMRQVRRLEAAWTRLDFPKREWTAELLLLTDTDVRCMVEQHLDAEGGEYEDAKSKLNEMFLRLQDEDARFLRTLTRPRQQGQTLLAYVIRWRTTMERWEQGYLTKYWGLFKAGTRVELLDFARSPQNWKDFVSRAQEILDVYIEQHGDPGPRELAYNTPQGQAVGLFFQSTVPPTAGLVSHTAEAAVFLRAELDNVDADRQRPRETHFGGNYGGKRRRLNNQGENKTTDRVSKRRYPCPIHNTLKHRLHECPRVLEICKEQSNKPSPCAAHHPVQRTTLNTLYMFPFTLRGKGGKLFEVAGLVDTGATYSLIDADLARMMDCEPFTIPHVPIVSPLGGAMGSTQACAFEVSLNHWLSVAEAIILPGLKGHLFLGANFIPENAAVFDVAKCTFAGQPSLGSIPLLLRQLSAPLWSRATPPAPTAVRTLWIPALGPDFDVSITTTDEVTMPFARCAATCPEDPRCTTARQELLKTFGHLLKEALPWGQHVSKAIRPYKIRLAKGATGTKLPQFRLTREEHEEVNRTVREWLAQGIIERSNSPYNVAVFLVDKDGGKAKRLVLNFKPLNEVTENPFSYLPVTEDILARIGADRPVVFAKIDLTLGYLQVPLARSSRELTAFSTQLGHFHFIRLPFGLALAPSFFHTMIVEILDELMDDKVAVYLDDLIMWGSSVEQLHILVTKVMKRLGDYQLVLHSRKCEFFVREVKFLGHTLSPDGVSPDARKVQAVENWPVPSTVRDCQVFLGLANYLRKFIKDFSAKARPINDFVAGKAPSFGAHQVASFRNLQEAITLASTLVHPDRNQLFELETDASQVQAGAILFLRDRQTKRRLGPVGFYSHSFNETQQRYSARDREILAIVLACEHWRYILAGLVFVVYTDHMSLALPIAPAGRVAGFLDRLSPFTFVTKWRSGALNAGADALSRAPPVVAATLTVDSPTEVMEGDPEEEEDPSRYDERDPVFLGGLFDPDTHADDELPFKTVGTRNPPPLDEMAAERLVEDLQLTPEELTQIRGGYESDKQFQSKWENAKPNGMVLGQRFYHKAHGLLWTRSVFQEWRLCVPNIPFRRGLAAKIHLNTGHMLVDLTVFYVTKLFYWRGLRNDVERLVNSCRECQHNKFASGPTQGALKPRAPPTRPGRSICLDFAQGFVPAIYSNRQVNALLVVVDRFTRWITLEPVLFAEGHSLAAVIWGILERRVFSQNGNPEEIISDNDPRFQGEFELAAARRKIKLMKTPLRNPRANGLAEHHVKLTKLMIKALAGHDSPAWVSHIHHVEFALNNFPREALNGFTPFQVARGCSPRGGRFMWSRVDTPNNLKRLLQQFQAIQGTAYDGMSEAAERMRELSLGSFRPETFKDDEWVLVRRKAMGDAEANHPANFGNNWVGPYQIISGGDSVVTFQSNFTNNYNRVSIKDVRRYYQPITELGYTKVPWGEAATRKRIGTIDKIMSFDPAQKAVYVTWKHCHEWHETVVALRWLADLPFWRFMDLMTEANNTFAIPEKVSELVWLERQAEIARKYGPHYLESTRAPPGHRPVHPTRT